MILGALEQSNLLGPSKKSFISQKVGHRKLCPFLILFVLVDAIVQKVVYFKSKSGTGGGFWLYACILW